MNRTTIYFIAGAFLLFISAPLALHLLGRGETESVENRSVAAPPPPTPGDLVDTGYYGTITQYIKDTFPLRSEAVAADAEIDLLVGDSPNPSVTLGDDGWLFYTPTLEGTCFNAGHAAIASDQIQLMGAIAEASGRQFVFMIVPDKASIYPEHVRAGSDNGCQENNRQLLSAEFEQPAFTTDLVTLWDELDSAKVAGLQYFRTDTHWNDSGAAIGAERLIETIEPGLWAADHLLPSGPSSKKRDLTGLLGTDDPEAAEAYVVERPGIAIERTETGKGKAAVTSSAASGSLRVIDAPTTIIRDSFFGPVEPLIAPYFANVRSTEGFDLEREPAGELLRSADVIIIESAERHVYNRLLDGLGHRLLVALIDDLDTVGLEIRTHDADSYVVRSETPIFGSHLVLRGQLFEGNIDITIGTESVANRSFTDGYAVLPIRADAFASATISAPGDVEITEAWVVDLP